jgi:toxin HigB-1
VKKLPIETQNIGRRKLKMPNNSIDLAELKIPSSSNRLQIDRWRIFKWNSGNVFEVKIIDYY